MSPNALHKGQLKTHMKPKNPFYRCRIDDWTENNANPILHFLHKLHYFQKVSWRKLVCDNIGLPRWIFGLRLADLGRLNTTDRLFKQGLTTNQMCRLCEVENDTIHRLFFTCNVPSQVWQKLLLQCNIRGTSCELSLNGLINMLKEEVQMLKSIEWC